MTVGYFVCLFKSHTCNTIHRDIIIMNNSLAKSALISISL